VMTITPGSNQSWSGTNEYGHPYHYPVLPRVNKFGEFDYTRLGLQQSSIPIPEPITSQTFNLTNEWQWISFYVMPDDLLLENIFGPILDNIFTIEDRTGGLVEGPWGWVDGIGPINVNDGYKIKLKPDEEPISYTITGSPIPLPRTISLSEGFTWMGHPTTVSKNALSTLQPLIDNGTLILAYQPPPGEYSGPPVEGSDCDLFKAISNDCAGHEGVWYNGIGDLVPGSVTIVKVNNDTSIVYDTELNNEFESVPFGTPGRTWDGDDEDALITNLHPEDPDLIIDLDFSSISAGALGDNSGNENFGILLNDFKVKLDNDVHPNSVKFPNRAKLEKKSREQPL